MPPGFARGHLFLGLVLYLGLEKIHRGDIDIQQFGDLHFGPDPLGAAGHRSDRADTQLLPKGPHDLFVGQVHDIDIKFPGHIRFGFIDLHFSGHLHPGNKISCRPDTSHARSHNMSDVHAERITHANLQPVGFTELDQGLGDPGDAVDGRLLHHGDAAHAHAHVDVDGYVGNRGGLL